MSNSLDTFVDWLRKLLLDHEDQREKRKDEDLQQAKKLVEESLAKLDLTSVIEEAQAANAIRPSRPDGSENPEPEGGWRQSEEYVRVRVTRIATNRLLRDLPEPPYVERELTPWQIAFPLVMPHLPAGCDEDRFREYLCAMGHGGLQASNDLSEAIARLDHEELAQQIKERIRKECPLAADERLHVATALQPPSVAAGPDSSTPRQYVTLQQMAALVNKSKRTLERLKIDGKLPTPGVVGGNGRADEWLYEKVRPILEIEYHRPLPDPFPADRFVRK